MEYLVRVYRYSDQYKDHAYPVAEIRMSGPIRGSDEEFAQTHGGDYIEIVENQEIVIDGIVYSD